MSANNITICGLPGSGKTTYLAALWHLVFSRKENTILKFEGLKKGSYKHLNSLSSRWLKAESQERTKVGTKEVVSMHLVDNDDESVTVSFPDLSGETYSQIWEDRTCEKDIASILADGSGLLLFIHADKVSQPRWVADEFNLTQMLGLPAMESAEVVSWKPKFAPTQVQLVDILQSFRRKPLNFDATKLVIIFSAWDLIEVQNTTPEVFLAVQLPLLAQYLDSSADMWDWRVFGVSAQGGNYEEKADELKACKTPSKRIRLIGGGEESHDLTMPLAWLME